MLYTLPAGRLLRRLRPPTAEVREYSARPAPTILFSDTEDLPGLIMREPSTYAPLPSEQRSTETLSGRQLTENGLTPSAPTTAASDFAVQKHMGRGEGKSFADIPNGAPRSQNRLNILWTYGVCEGKISRSRLVDLFATMPAKNQRST